MDTHFRAWAQLLSSVRLSAPPQTWPARLPCPQYFPSKNTGVGYCFLLHNTHLSLTEMPWQVSMDHFYLPGFGGKKIQLCGWALPSESPFIHLPCPVFPDPCQNKMPFNSKPIRKAIQSSKSPLHLSRCFNGMLTHWNGRSAGYFPEENIEQNQAPRVLLPRVP